VGNRVRLIWWFLGLGLFCITGQKAEGRGQKTENGFEAGRDARRIGILGLLRLWNWAGAGAFMRWIGFVLGLFFSVPGRLKCL